MFLIRTSRKLRRSYPIRSENLHSEVAGVPDELTDHVAAERSNDRLKGQDSCIFSDHLGKRTKIEPLIVYLGRGGIAVGRRSAQSSRMLRGDEMDLGFLVTSTPPKLD